MQKIILLGYTVEKELRREVILADIWDIKFTGLGDWLAVGSKREGL